MQIIKEPEYTRRKSKGYCVAAFCKNKARAGHRFCHKCAHRYQKETNPLVYWYKSLKQNARRRGKEFSLTKEDFRFFCTSTGYLELKGKEGNKFSIDRIDPEKGYSLDNIQMITLSQNTSKHWIDMKILHGRYLTDEELEFYSSVGHTENNIDEIGEQETPF